MNTAWVPLLLGAWLAWAGADELDDPARLAKALRQLRRAGDTTSALALLDDRAARLLRDERVLGERIQLHLEAGEPSTALALGAELPTGRRGFALPLGVAVTRLQALRGDLQGARQNLDALLAARPEHPDLLGLAVALDGAAGDHARARRTLDALEGTIAPDWHRALTVELTLGRARELLGTDDLLERAVDLLEEAHTLAPERVDVRALLVRALVRWQRVDRARALVDAVVERASGADRAELLHARGLILRAELNEAEAVAVFEEVLQLDPAHGRARLALAACHREAGDAARARALVDAVLGAARDDLEALMLSADLHGDAGDWDAAAGDLERLLSLKPRHLKGLWMLSRVRARQRRMDDVSALMDRYRARLEQLAEMR